MEKKFQRSIIAAVIMGLFAPASSLIYIYKLKLAFGCIILWMGTLFLLVYAPFAFFSTTLIICLFFMFFVWLFAYGIGIYYATKGIKEDDYIVDLGPCMSLYLVSLFIIITLAFSLPIDFFVAKHTFQNIEKNDVLVTQPVGINSFINIDDHIIFLDEKLQLRVGEVIALPNDILEKNEKNIVRNNREIVPKEKEIRLKQNPFMIPHNMILVKYQNNEKNNDDSIDSLTLITLDQIYAKALYLFFSGDTKKIGLTLSTLKTIY